MLGTRGVPASHGGFETAVDLSSKRGEMGRDDAAHRYRRGDDVAASYLNLCLGLAETKRRG